MDGKPGDDRFSRHGFGGMRGYGVVGACVYVGVVGACVCVGVEVRSWRGAHATRQEPFAGSRRFRAGEQQLCGR